MDKQNGIDRLKEDIFDYVKTAYETGYEDGNYDNEPFSDGMSCDVHDAISKIVDEFFFEGAGNTSEAVKSLWALYDKFEDAEHVVCGDAAKLLEKLESVRAENGQLHAVVEQIEPDFFKKKCRVCGCDWNHPCEGGCFWIGDDLCSKCLGEMLRKDKNNG